MMRKKHLFIGIGVFWLLVLVLFIGMKEFTLRTGTEVVLHTLPIDPYDIFRGDYVTFKYEISELEIVGPASFAVGDTVYVGLTLDGKEIVAIGSPTLVRPSSIFIKGTVEEIWDNFLIIRYGIEDYFVPEGKGYDIETADGEIDVLVAIDRFGNAGIKEIYEDGNRIRF